MQIAAILGAAGAKPQASIKLRECHSIFVYQELAVGEDSLLMSLVALSFLVVLFDDLMTKHVRGVTQLSVTSLIVKA